MGIPAYAPGFRGFIDDTIDEVQADATSDDNGGDFRPVSPSAASKPTAKPSGYVAPKPAVAPMHTLPSSGPSPLVIGSIAVLGTVGLGIAFARWRKSKRS